MFKQDPESPQCQLSTNASHILLVSLLMRLLAIIQIAFIGKSLLNLRTDTDT
ncbi:hypothetical protein L873DRAFT_1812670, partial [Choiromyces venosus 120613-1]